MTREDLIQKYTNREDISDELKIEILEDISDSIDTPESDPETEVLKAKVEELEWKYGDLKEKYIRRFSEMKEDDPEDDPEEEEEKEEIIDVKEI